MPYIVQDRRLAVDLKSGPLMNAGELNYAICMECIEYIATYGLGYQTINDVIGALEGAKAEFQRRVVAPYEDQKIIENGDLPWPSR